MPEGDVLEEQWRVLPHGRLYDELAEFVDGQVGHRLLHLRDAGVLVQEPRRQGIRSSLHCGQVREE
eukprot:2357987-Prorocentrum_lima.AAC.1